MKIEHVYISNYKDDVRYLRPCVASIRNWYPDIPITIIPDFYGGAYDLSEACNAWNLNVFETSGKHYGVGWSLLEAYFQDKIERFLYLDADIVFTGRVIDELEKHDEDIVASGRQTRWQLIEKYWFDLEKLAAFDPEFEPIEEGFNTGLFVAETGALLPGDFEHLLEFSEPRRVRYPDIFKLNDSGVLNYLWLKKRQTGEMTIGDCDVMRFCPSTRTPVISVESIVQGAAPPYALHWAGASKRRPFSRLYNGHVLQYFEDIYYKRVPGGRIKQALRKSRFQGGHLLGRVRRKMGLAMP